METNPRVRMPVEWAPPPPIAVPDRQHPQQPPVQAPSQEKEFEDILGSLVEHYSALPPPTFGEPHEVAFESGAAEQTITTRKRSRTGLWVGLTLGGVLLACSLAVGAFYLWQLKHKVPLAVEPGQGPRAQRVRTPQDLKLTVHRTETKVANAKAPKVEPLPETLVQPVEGKAGAAGAEVAPPATPARRKVAPLRAKAKRHVRRHVRRRHRRRGHRQRPAPTRAKAPTADDWEDPYK